MDVRGPILLQLLCFLLVAIAACNKREATQVRTDHQSQPATDVCALLSKQEIEAVQGSPITATKSSGESQEVFRLSQCYYSA
ncbi:MAG: hypothetical protein QOH24_2134, partial [Verrucomicrobiota bacterium]